MALARLRHNNFDDSGEIKKNKLGVIGLAAQQYVQSSNCRYGSIAVQCDVLYDKRKFASS
jgi:hypothetical protein